jgi:hypothetical protein
MGWIRLHGYPRLVSIGYVVATYVRCDLSFFYWWCKWETHYPKSQIDYSTSRHPQPSDGPSCSDRTKPKASRRPVVGVHRREEAARSESSTSEKCLGSAVSAFARAVSAFAGLGCGGRAAPHSPSAAVQCFNAVAIQCARFCFSIGPRSRPTKPASTGRLCGSAG